MEELYEKYKGRKADCYGITGTVVGYDSENLVIAVDDNRRGWLKEEDPFNSIIHGDHDKGQRFFYISETHIIDDK